MADLQLDYEGLRSIAARADQLAGEFHAAERISDDTAGLVGHDGLAAAVRDFGHKWDVLRGDLAAGLSGLADAIVAVVDTFADVDEAMAKAGRE